MVVFVSGIHCLSPVFLTNSVLTYCHRKFSWPGTTLPAAKLPHHLPLHSHLTWIFLVLHCLRMNIVSDSPWFGPVIPQRCYFSYASPNFSKNITDNFQSRTMGFKGWLYLSSHLIFTELENLIILMATHSNILAWEIPCREEPGMLQPMGLQGVTHDLITKRQQQEQNYSFYFFFFFLFFKLQLELRNLSS